MKIYGDHLQRLQMVEDVIKIIKSCADTGRSTTFSIEGEWGKGKTWVVEKIADSLEGFDLTKEKSSNVDSSNSEYLVFRYNAWEKDYYDEPLLAILITLINQLNKHLVLENIIKGELVAICEMSKDILEDALRAISKRVIGVDVVDLGKRGWQIAKKSKAAATMKMEADYSENNIEKDVRRVVYTLNMLSKNIPIVFIVDELDRCLPEHAIKTLERLHHVFGKVDSSVTIISVNEAQLKTTVQKMFGDDIPFESYLRKFVDFRISLNAGSADVEELQIKLETFLKQFSTDGDSSLFGEVIANLCNNMTARDFEKVCTNAMLCHSLVGKETTHFSYDYALVELVLFSCKIALEKEKSISHILPIYGNRTESQLGDYLKEFLGNLPRNKISRITKPVEKICYFCLKAIMRDGEIEKYYPVTLPMDMSEIQSYFEEYVRFYKLIK